MGPVQVEEFKLHPQPLYACSTEAFRTAGMAAYIGQQALKISISRSICSSTWVSSGKENGFRRRSGAL